MAAGVGLLQPLSCIDGDEVISHGFSRDLLPAHRATDRLADRLHLLGLGHRRRARQDVPGPGMAILGERAHRDGGDVALVDQRLGRVAVGPAHDVAPADLLRPDPGVGREAARSRERPLDA